jgi:hypothetical protein
MPLRGGFFGHDAAVHLAALDREVHVAGALVAGDDLALDAERMGHDGGEIGIAIDLAGAGPGHGVVALHQVRDGAVGRLRSNERDLRLAAETCQPGELADIVVEAR